MPGRLETIELTLARHLGSAFISRQPDLVYSVNQILVRFLHSRFTLSELHQQMVQLLTDAISADTFRSMVLVLDDGSRVRLSEEELSEIADRVLALSYTLRPTSSEIQDALFDFSREGSFCAMRELAARYPLEPSVREWLLEVLAENDQLT